MNRFEQYEAELKLGTELIENINKFKAEFNEVHKGEFLYINDITGIDYVDVYTYQKKLAMAYYHMQIESVKYEIAEGTFRRYYSERYNNDIQRAKELPFTEENWNTLLKQIMKDSDHEQRRMGESDLKAKEYKNGKLKVSAYNVYNDWGNKSFRGSQVFDRQLSMLRHLSKEAGLDFSIKDITDKMGKLYGEQGQVIVENDLFELKFFKNSNVQITFKNDDLKKLVESKLK